MALFIDSELDDDEEDETLVDPEDFEKDDDTDEEIPQEIDETLGAMLPQIPLSESMIDYIFDPYMEEEAIEEGVISSISNWASDRMASKRAKRLITHIALLEKRIEMAKKRSLYRKAVPKLEKQLRDYKIELSKIELQLNADEKKDVQILKKKAKQSVTDNDTVKAMSESVMMEGFYSNRGFPKGKVPSSKLKVLGAPLLLPKNERAAARTEMYFKKLGKGVGPAARRAVTLAMNDVRADKRLSRSDKFKPIYCTMSRFSDSIDIELYGDITDEVSAKITVHLKDGKYEDYSVMASTRNKETSPKSEGVQFIDSEDPILMDEITFQEAVEANSTKINGFKGSINVNMQKAQGVTKIPPAQDNPNVKTWIGNVKDWIRKTIDWFKGDQNKSPVVKQSFTQVENQVGKLEGFIQSPQFLSSQKRDQAFTSPFRGQLRPTTAYASTDDFIDDEVTSEAADMEPEIKPIVDKLNSLGYTVKYASPGHTKLRKKEDNERDGKYYGKLYTDARIMFTSDYKLPDAPKGWKWRTVDKKDYLDVIPKEHDPKDGSPDEAFNKWKKEYMDSLRNWANSLPKADSSNITKANDNTAENKKRKSEEPNIITHESAEEEWGRITMESIIEDMLDNFE